MSLQRKVHETFGVSAEIEYFEPRHYIRGNSSVFCIFIIVSNEGKIIQGAGANEEEVIASLRKCDSAYMKYEI